MYFEKGVFKLVSKSRRIMWVGHVAQIGTTSSYTRTAFVVIPSGKD